MKKYFISIHLKFLNIFFSFFLLYFLFCTPCPTFANTLSLGMYPPIAKIKMAPGTEVKKNISITNYSDMPTNISIKIKSFINSDKKNGEIKFSDKNKTFISNMVKITDGNSVINQLLLAPKEKKNMSIIITSPENAIDHDYYFSILFISKNEEKIKSNASFISGGIGMNILVSILTQEQKDVGYIKDFHSPLFTQDHGVPFQIELANQGNHFFTIKGNLIINNLLLRSKQKIAIPETNILENSSRYITDALSTGTSKIIWNPQFPLGIYKADLFLQTSNNSITFYKSIYFYSYSQISLFIFLIFLFFLIAIIFKINRK